MTETPITSKYRIHPAIGVARLGDSPAEFCISPEKPAALPIECDSSGNAFFTPDGTAERTITRFKDAEGRIKRQAARFNIYVYDEESPEGRPLALGDKVRGGGNHGTLVDIQWRVYLANKKAVWYQFNALAGEHGYDSTHPLRNPDITDENERQQLIIDPGPRYVDSTTRRRAEFSRSGSGSYAPTFPPEHLHPHSIDTLGEILTDDHGRLLVLGGYGNSGSCKKGFGQPRIDTYANNDGWFDDTSDGPVMARLVMFSPEVSRLRYIDVEYPAWVLAAYPRYCPEILDIITLEEVLQDVAIRDFAARPDLYGPAGSFHDPKHIDPTDLPALTYWKAGRLEWNPQYRPWFYRDIWPILFRADEMNFVTNVLQQSNFPHNQTNRGNFDPNILSLPRFGVPLAERRHQSESVRKNRSGDLLIEALDPALMTVEDKLQQRKGPESACLCIVHGLIHEGDARTELRDAAAEFAEAMAPRTEADDGDPAAYLQAWVRAYERAQSAPPEDPVRIGYEKAAAKFAERITKVLEDLRPDASSEAPPSGAAEEETTSDVALFKARRGDSEVALRDDDSLGIVEAVQRYAKMFRTGKLLHDQFAKDAEACRRDPYGANRRFLYDLLREPGEENDFRLQGKPNSRIHHLPLMPLLCGDNPLSNQLPSKFLRLTDYQLFLIRQWARGLFYNEILEGWVKADDVPVFRPYSNWVNRTGRDLDRGVLMNLMGGSFCPGAEVNWIIRNPAIYLEPFRLKADPAFSNFRQTAANANQNSRALTVPESDYASYVEDDLSQGNDFRAGLQPGDLTKYMAQPWQSDFNECTTQSIDITYDLWNNIDYHNEHDPVMKLQQQVWETLWWPAHRPLQAWEATFVNGQPSYRFLDWARGVPGTNAGDLKMVTEWSKLGFVIRNPYVTASALDAPWSGVTSVPAKYLSVERSQEEES
ncbi:MAG TPA: LodA/GoxA family CTQ-dependent oxidase [Bryobacteraceae bacterium]|nr:LodA/GoxA family CTQ-dependent oxidase [Bryobacteraceae bacterium]